MKNQGLCGSCWAFAAVGQLESHALITDGIALDLSEQQVVSCNVGGAGCQGGWHGDAYSVFQSPGSVHESCYPYEAADAPCRQWECGIAAAIDGYSLVANDPQSTKLALLDGPLFVSINVSEMFYFYSRGIYHEGGDKAPRSTHCILLVGYDDDLVHGLGQGAWIVKNSWGADWGLEGYAYVAYDTEFQELGARQLHYRPGSAGQLRLAEPTSGEAWLTGSTRRLTWVSSLAAARFELSLVLDGQDVVIAGVVDGTAREATVTAPAQPVTDLAVRIAAIDADGNVLASDTSRQPIEVVARVVTWPDGGAVIDDPDLGPCLRAMTPDGAGGSIVAWSCGPGLFVTRLGADGATAWAGAPVLVPDLLHATAMGDGQGGAYVCGNREVGGVNRVALVRIDAGGGLVWGSSGRLVDNITTGSTYAPLLASNADGGAVVLWRFASGSQAGLRASRVTASGQYPWGQAGVPVTSRVSSSGVGLAVTASGRTYVAYICRSQHDYDRLDLLIQAIDPDGALPWGANGVAICQSHRHVQSCELVATAVGGLTAAWTSGDLGAEHRLYLQRLDPDGTRCWGDGGRDLAVYQHHGEQFRFDLDDDARDGNLVAWTRQSVDSEQTMVIQRLGADGTDRWGPDGVLLDAPLGRIYGGGLFITAVPDGAGGAFVFWPRYGPIAIDRLLGQHLDPFGQFQWSRFGQPIAERADGVSYHGTRACRGPAGVVALGWHRQDLPDHSIRLQRLDDRFPTAPRCQVSAEIRRGDTILDITEAVVRGCPQGDGDELVIRCDFHDADVSDQPVILPSDIQLDTSGLGYTFCGPTTDDEAGTPANGYVVTLRRRGILGCSSCLGDGCDPATISGGPLPVRHRGYTVGAIADLAVRSGDVSGDGQINLTELIGFAAALDAPPDSPAHDGCYDLSDDGTVGWSDWSLLEPHYGHDAGGGPDGAPLGLVAAAPVTWRPAADGTTLELVARGGDQDALVVALEADGGQLAAARWDAGGTHDLEVRLLPTTGPGDQRLLLATGAGLAAAGEVVLGRLTPGPDGDPGVRIAGGEVRQPDGIAAFGGGTARGVAAMGDQLRHPYPNPCNPLTTVEFSVAQRGRVAVRIYDVAGRLVRTLVDGDLDPATGPQRFVWHGRDDGGQRVSSGTYVVRMVTPRQTLARRVVVLR